MTSNTKARAQPEDIATYVPYHPKVDNSTYGNIDEIYTTHYHVDWYINWKSNTIMGWIIHDMTVKSDVLYIQLDSWDLFIEEVNLMPPGSAMYATEHAGTTPVSTNSTLVWELKSPNPDSGDVLVI